MVAVPNPQTWIDGIVYLEADYNREIRDSVNFLLRPPFFDGKNTTATALTDNAFTAIPLQTEVTNTEGTAMHQTGTNPSRVTVQHEGWWDWFGRMSFDVIGATGGNVGRRITGLRVNGTTFVPSRADSGPATAATQDWVRGETKWSVYLKAGDYVELMAFHDAGVGTMQTWVLSDETYPRLVGKWRSKGAA